MARGKNPRRCAKPRSKYFVGVDMGYMDVTIVSVRMCGDTEITDYMYTTREPAPGTAFCILKKEMVDNEV